ncbi:hypothetical protein AB1Y20_015892 [Prymnesium parvum]|uniref:Diacylglycerol kinase n=1 Tax=Prymnesium parvum TaxID=97485 RepID=A0AB34K228_PRYPA
MDAPLEEALEEARVSLVLPLEADIGLLLQNREPAPLLHSLALLATALLVLLIFRWRWPAPPQPQLTWTLQGELERSRIRGLLLPTAALKPRDPHPTADTPSKSRVSREVVRRVQAVGDHISAAAGLESRARRAHLYSWVFSPHAADPRDYTPLLVFVNCGSGGRQGEEALSQLQALLSEQQVVDLSSGYAEEVLQSFRSVGRFRVLACGGDGTVGWVLSLLDGASLEYTPPVAILPLGTGNDLARALGWGGRHLGRDLVPFLEEVERAQATLLDRWAVTVEHARPRSRGQIIMQNYIGIGVDAKVALEWHRKRQLYPHRFRSVFRNKIRYARYGAQHLVGERDFSELCSQLTIEADGVPVTLPAGTEGVIILNIASYGGGSDLWGEELGHLWNAESMEAEAEGGGSSGVEGVHAPVAVPGVALGSQSSWSAAGGGGVGHRRMPSGGSWGALHSRSTTPTRTGSPGADAFDTPTMDDGKLEIVAVEGVHQLALAQMSLSRARRICQCSTLSITSKQRLPIQIDGEPSELEPTYAPRTPLRITVRLHNQAVMLSRAKVRADGVALEALDRALQEGVITVDQRNWVLREVARRNGFLRRRAVSCNSFGGSNLSLHSLTDQY